jgi:hypothetical protein
VDLRWRQNRPPRVRQRELGSLPRDGMLLR